MEPTELSPEVLQRMLLVMQRNPEVPCLVDWANQIITVGEVVVLMGSHAGELAFPAY